MHKYPIAFLPFLLLLHLTSYAQSDSLIIKGQMRNLNGRLYRQASFITFSRNNLFMAQNELSSQAPLQADGSFRIALPIIYQKEEIYLDYAGRASATFLGSAGEVGITFDGDSLGKAHIFHFTGVNSEANNLYSYYQEAEKKAFDTNKTLGANFYKTFWDKDFSEAKTVLDQRKSWRQSLLTSQTGKLKSPPSTLLHWTNGIIENEARQNEMEAALSTNQSAIPPRFGNPTLTSWPLTLQKVTSANRFGEYGEYAMNTFNNNRPDQKNALSAKTMADMFLDYIKPLSPAEREKLMGISERGTVANGEVDFLSSIFSRSPDDINALFDFEREKRVYDKIFAGTAPEFLSARFLTKNFYKYPYKQIVLLNRHIQKQITDPLLKKSLAEVVNMELKDTVSVQKMISFQDAKGAPVEILPGYWGAYSGKRGNAWLDDVLASKKGSTIYLILWDINDPSSRQTMDHMPSLRAQVPSDVEFLYLHGRQDGDVHGDDLVKQFIVRHHLAGTHLLMTSDQMIDIMISKMRTTEPQAFAIVQPNGKFKTRNAPPPSEPQKLILLLSEATK